MKTTQQNRNNKRTEIEQFDWFIERIQTHRYFALTSYCDTIGQSNNAFSVLRFSLAGKWRRHVLIFSYIGWSNKYHKKIVLFTSLLRVSKCLLINCQNFWMMVSIYIICKVTQKVLLELSPIGQSAIIMNLKMESRWHRNVVRSYQRYFLLVSV